MSNRPRLSAFVFLCGSFVFSATPPPAQDRAGGDPTIPTELTPRDPDIRALLGFGDTSCKAGGEAWTQKLQKALDLANSRRLVSERPLLEASLASALIAQGEPEKGFLLFQKALEDSIGTKKQVLEADILISLSSEAQMKGDTQGAMELVRQALSLSERSGNLYGKARALGELGKLKLQTGQTEEAATLIQQALEIDKLNSYKYEALHLYYEGSYLGVIGKEDEAVRTLADARTKAIAAKDTVTFIQAENAYAFGLAKKGKPDEAIRQMDLLNKMDAGEFIQDPASRSCLESYLRLPFVHLIFLEGFANVLQVASQKEAEIGVWQEVFSVSQGLNLFAGEAEAKEKMANLEGQLKRTEDALRDYSVAADLYRKLNSDAFLDRVQISEAILLENSGRGGEAIPLVEEIASYAKQRKLRQLEFRAYITLAGIYQSATQTEKARAAFEKAASLVHPGPFDDELDNKTVHLTYVSLADIYRKLQIPTKELTSIDQAFFVSFYLKDEAEQKREVDYLDQRLRELKIRELVEERQKEGKLSESLIYSYVLYLRDGAPAKPAEDQNWQRILSLPFQIAQRPGGAAELVAILKDLGSLQGIEKLPLLNALARYYIAEGADPDLTERYALQAEKIVANLQGDQTALKVEASCELAVAYARQSKKELAEQKSSECVDLAAKTHNEQTIVYADAANSMVQAQTGNIAAARSSLQTLVAKNPDNAELLVQLAMSFASARLYEEATSQLRTAVGKLLSAGDKRTAAGAYVRVSIVLNSDSSDTGKKLQLECLNDALNLYRELDSKADEAFIFVALGDYYLRISENTQAISQYAKAKEFAQGIGRKELLAQSLLGLGNAYQAERNFVAASESHRAAGDLFHGLGNEVGETNSLRNLGRDYYELNDPTKALPILLQAQKVAAKAGPIYQYFADYFLGDFYNSQGEYEKARASFADAVEITTKAGDTQHSAYSHLALAGVIGFLGAWDDSVSETEVALKLFEQIGDRDGQGACWAHLTEIYSDRTSSLKDFSKAQECYRKALEFGSGKTVGLDLLEVYLQTSKYAEAAKVARDAIAECIKEKDPNCQAHGLISLSEAERLAGNLKASRSAWNEAHPLVAKSTDVYLNGRLRYQGSRLLVSEGKFDQALSSYEQLITLIETVKGRLGTQEQRSLAENYSFIYDELVSLLYSMSKNSQTDRLRFASMALEYAEKNKARQFAQSWGRVFKEQMALALPVSVREREELLTSERDRLSAELAATADSNQAAQSPTPANLAAQLAAVQDELQLFLKSLRKAAPQYAAIAYPEDISIANLPVRQGETLIEFKVTEDSTFAWIVQNPTGKGSELKAFYTIPKKRIWFVEKVSLLRGELNSAQPEAVDLKICEELFGTLLPGDAAKLVRESPTLVLIPDDALFVLPFELYSPDATKGDFPLLNKATTYYPSAVSMRLARNAALPSNWRESFLGVADPITSPSDERFELVKLQARAEKTDSAVSPSLSKEDPKPGMPTTQKLQSRGFSFDRLPGTAVEVESIATLLQKRQETVDLRLGIDATKSKLLDTDLSQFRFLHFATHGVLAVDTGIQEPSLVLSSDGTDPSHMFLSMSEILRLKLQSESVVLSACNTGSGKISRAEGVMSLGRAFLAAGANSVTVSLWQVSDDSTALLMETYYKGILEHKTKSAALAEARYAVFANGAKNPFFWAPFIVIGE